MDQELEAVTNSGPRLITTKMWVILIDFTHPSPTPVTTNFMEYMFDICTLYSLLPSIPYAVALLLHCLHGISPLEGWMGQQSPSSSQRNSFVSILLHPGMAGGASACLR